MDIAAIPILTLAWSCSTVQCTAIDNEAVVWSPVQYLLSLGSGHQNLYLHVYMHCFCVVFVFICTLICAVLPYCSAGCYEESPVLLIEHLLLLGSGHQGLITEQAIVKLSHKSQRRRKKIQME